MIRVLLVVLLVFVACSRESSPTAQGSPQASVGDGTEETGGGIDRSHKGKPFPDLPFLQDDQGGAGETGFELFLGVPTLVNFWASWCVPCVKELPTLKALADSKSFDGHILPLSQDSGPQMSVRAFMAKHGVEELGNYQDPKMAVAGALGVNIMPTTILFDENGKEVWRYVGDLDWTSPEAAKLLGEATPSYQAGR